MSNDFPVYKIGERDIRPWGEYEVTDVGQTVNAEEFCEKKITVLPQQILSLQSHKLRREVWRVLSGQLTAIVDQKAQLLHAGDTLSIPQGHIHAMANLSDSPCIVFERQEGICREADIQRYLDAYGRDVEGTDNADILASITVYRKILSQLKS